MIETNNIIWKPIKGFENRYLISNDGNVFSIKHNKNIKQEIRRNYYSVQLFNGKQYKHYSIHRLVASNFIPNPNNFPYVNHKDENKLNNHVSNLEWCTASYNVKYGTAIAKAIKKKSKSVLQLDKQFNLINKFSSISEAERQTKIPNANIVKCCKNMRKTAGGFIWKYEN